MNRQNVILALGLLLIIANGIASGELQSLWHDVTGLGTKSGGNSEFGPLVKPGTGDGTVNPQFPDVPFSIFG